ncbi:MAG: sensor histidine kinase [Gammaproteobacteria bacterium]|nr:sensor histidine kinase [Gammaproteobacteria bacterium]
MMLNWTPKGRKQSVPPVNGVIEGQYLASEKVQYAGTDNCYLPDFSTANAVVALILISQLVALVLSLVSDTSVNGYFIGLAKISMLMLWMILTSACVLTLVRPVLARRGVIAATCFSLGLVLANIALLSEAVYWFGQYFSETRFISSTILFPQVRWEFLLRNLVIGILVSAAVLRYFYVTHQWRTNVEKEAQSRIAALQACIRPHFLFNSMNTIAALTRTDPAAAEQAVEDLADLFRASLGNPDEAISLEQELDVARVYQRMEEQRLGSRLSVDWQLNGISLHTQVPGLIIQPLLENAIYHGIEPLESGGVITIVGNEQDDMVIITISNPLSTGKQERTRHGHQIALDNIRQRLELAYGEKACLKIEQTTDCFQVMVGFPLMQQGVKKETQKKPDHKSGQKVVH